MQVTSKLPFPAMSFRHWDDKGREIGVLVVKGSCHPVNGGDRPRFLAKQPAILLADLFHGEPGISPVKQESEIAPFKPRTDVTLNAVARSPEARQMEAWPVSIRIDRLMTYGFHVFGERRWEPVRTATGRKWQLSPSEKMSFLPITYAYAYGGMVKVGDEDEADHPYNPVGRGLLTDELLDAGQPVPASQIGLQAEFAATRPNEPMTVCGFGPITKSWLPRLDRAGTFDEAWKRDRHPRMPVDYDYGYWNAAPLPLQIDPYLQGNETVTLTGINHDPRPYQFGLPGIELGCKVSRAQNQEEILRLNLDTVHCDVSDADCENHIVTLVWRVLLPEPEDIREVEIVARKAQGGSR